MMNCRILLVLLLFAALLGSAGAAYDLCDSIERDSNSSLFRCNFTTSKIDFTQQSIDNFWEKIKTDGDYTAGRIATVEWKLKSMVIDVSDDLRFIEPEGMDVAWDIVLSADVNTVHDVNQAIIIEPLRSGNQTAIKKPMDSMPEYLISFAPSAGRRGIRNLTVEKPVGALDVYILGSSIKKMQIDLEGDLAISGGHIENIGTLKAKKITLSNKGYIYKVESIEAESISLDGQSYIRNVGIFGETAINVTGAQGLSLKGKSYVDNAIGGIEASAGISLEGESKMENISFVISDTIQWIKANDLMLAGKSAIRGFGGTPGRITILGQFSMDDSFIAGKQENMPRTLTAESISLSNNAYLSGFAESINATGKDKFKLENGASIKELAGKISSCAVLSLDGNKTTIIFTPSGAKSIKAPDLVLDNNARIYCVGDATCDYSFEKMGCGLPPSATLNIVGSAIGNAPFMVQFSGACDGKGSTAACMISFGDGTEAMAFAGTASHTYETAGSFKAVLTATNDYGQEGKNEKTITVLEQGVAPPAGNVQLSVSKQSAKPGEQISITIACDGNFESFSMQNDLGIETITGPPANCPATLGPFDIPANATAGTHSFTVSGTMKNGATFSKTVQFTVEPQGFIIPGLPFDLSGITGIGLAGIILLIVLILTLVVLLKRKKKKKAPGAQKGAAESGSGKKQAIASAGARKVAEDVPPWLRTESEEEESEETTKWEIAEKETPAEEKKPLPAPAEETLEEKKPVQEELQPKQDIQDLKKVIVPEAFAFAKEKPEEKTPLLPAKVPEQESTASAGEKELAPSPEFRELVERLKGTESKQLPAEKKAAPAEVKPEEKANVDWASLENELFGPPPEKTAGEKEAEIEEIPAVAEKAPAPEKPPEEKKPEAKKGRFSFFKKQETKKEEQDAKIVPKQEEKNPEEAKKKKEELSEEEKKLPPWLRKK